MDRQELIQRLMATFLEELDEHLRTMNRELLALEKDPAGDDRGELLKTLFRSAHSMKGASRAVSVLPIEQVAHRLEDVLAAVRDRKMSVSRELFSLLFQVVDGIEAAAVQLRESERLHEDALAPFIAQLDTVIRGGAPPLSEQSAAPAPSDDSAPVARPTAANRTRGMPESKMASDSRATDSRGVDSRVVTASEVSHHASPAADREVMAADASPVNEEHAATVEAHATSVDDKRASGLASTVRVAHEKLDSLLAQSGELLVARRRVEARPAELQAVRDFVSAWSLEWRRAETSMQATLQKTSGGVANRHSGMPRNVLNVLQTTRDRLRRLERQLERFSRAIVADARQLHQACDAFYDDVHRIRMIPFAEACGGLDRAVRDLAAHCGKPVKLVVKGGDIEVDRSVLEGLSDPLLHLVRNAVDHGVETPDGRRVSKKPACATVTVEAQLLGSQVEVSVTDDGRGLDLAAIRQQARKRNLPEPQDERELLRHIFLPGFSTAPIITDLSGRGVGLDVVKARLESLHGLVDVKTEAGFGTRFVLTVPLTLTTIHSLLVEAAGQAFAFASTNVFKLIRFQASAIRAVQGRDMLLLGKAPVPVASLATTLGLKSASRPSNGAHVGVLVESSDQKMVFVVDSVNSEQEVVIKNLGRRIRRTKYITGATLLPSGRIALLVNAANLVRAAAVTPQWSVASDDRQTAGQPELRRLMIVEDSVTTRTLMKSILETAGYEVIAAADGQLAWESLQDQPVDLVISDVDMPRKDGFELTHAIRESSRLEKLPVILVTGRESEQDKKRGIQVGADAYLVKTGFDQANLLQTIRQLL